MSYGTFCPLWPDSTQRGLSVEATASSWVSRTRQTENNLTLLRDCFSGYSWRYEVLSGLNKPMYADVSVKAWNEKRGNVYLLHRHSCNKDKRHPVPTALNRRHHRHKQNSMTNTRTSVSVNIICFFSYIYNCYVEIQSLVPNKILCTTYTLELELNSMRQW